MIVLDHPWMLLLLAAIPVWLFGRWKRLEAPALGFSCRALLDPLMGKGRWRYAWVPLLLKALGLALLIAALAKPQWEERNVSLEREGIDILLLLDISSSMAERGLDTRQSNLDTAREVVKGFVGLRKEDRIGLIAFARFPERICPLTLDHQALLSFVDGLACVDRGSEMDGTAIGAALAETARLFDGAGQEGGETLGSTAGRIAILLTDGEENQFVVDPIGASLVCADLGIKVYTVAAALGAKEGTVLKSPPVPTELHREVARITGGLFETAATASDLDAVYDKIDALERTPMEARHFSVRHELYRWVLLPALLLILFEFLLSETFFLRIP